MNARAENITPEELEELKEAFSLLDKDGDGDLRRTDSRLRHSFSWTGKISADELAFVMHNLGQTASQSEVHGLMRRVDSDGDGTIDFSEFLSAMAKRGKVDKVERTNTCDVAANSAVTTKSFEKRSRPLTKTATDSFRLPRCTVQSWKLVLECDVWMVVARRHEDHRRRVDGRCAG